MKNILTSILVFVSAQLLAQKPIFTNAKLKEATVYFNSAEMVHTANILLTNGTSEVVIKNVANYLNENPFKLAHLHQ